MSTYAGVQTVHDHQRMIYTGPDHRRDHRVKVENEHRAVGIGRMSMEGTSDGEYLWRAAPTTPFPKRDRVGDIGWGIEAFTDWSAPCTGRQIMMGEFRADLENNFTHRLQCPWYAETPDKQNKLQTNTPVKTSDGSINMPDKKSEESINRSDKNSNESINRPDKKSNESINRPDKKSDASLTRGKSSDAVVEAKA